MSGFELNDDFIDREVQQYSFKRHLIEVSRVNGRFLLIYSGVGRVGKTSLLKQFEKIIVAGFYKNFICVRYNFDNNEFTQADDMLVTLKTLRASLTKKYRAEFPLFDKGCIYLAQKSGEFVSAEQQRSVMKSSAVLRGFKAHLNSMKSKTDEAVTVTKILNNLFDSTGEFLSDVSNTSLVLKAGKYFVDFLDGVIAAREEKARAKGDANYGELLAELNKLNGEDAPAPVREILPRLFAKDLSYWLDENKKTLIIFLDAYEKLTGEEQGKKKYGRLISKNRDVPVDWWVGDLLNAERVMWVIAGRYQIKEIGEINLESRTVENYTVDVFDKNSSNKYLQLQGIEEAELHTAIINLTGGHPYYLRKCAETYKNYKDKGKVPRPSDFGKNLDDIVEKTVGSLDESGQLMTQCLCILKTWTDEVAANVITNFSNVTYKRVKKMIARSEQLSFDDETGYTFDKTIDSFLFPALKRDVTCRKLFTDIRDAANVYFKKFFAETVRYYDSKQNYYFGIWSEIILRTMDAPADLMKFYYENFEPLEKRFDCSTPEIVVQKFFNKVGDDKTLPSAYFQSRFAFVRYLQNRDKEALEPAEAAYYKVEKLSLSKDELPFKISIMTALALSFSWLSRSKDEIKLCEEIVRECEKCFATKDDRIIKAKDNLARALYNGDRENDALKIRKQIFETFDEDGGERYIEAADAFARALKGKAALPIRRKNVEHYEKNNDDENLCSELYTLINLLSNLSGEEYLEEKAERFSQYVALCKTLGEKISYYELEDFADTLKELGRDEEAEEFLESQTNDLKKQIESCDEPDSETLELILNLINLLEDTGQDDEAERWREKINETVHAIIKRYTAEPVADFDAALSELRYCAWSISYEQEKIDLKRAILSLSEKKPGVEDFEIIVAKEDLIDSLKSCEENIEEVNQLFEEIESCHRKNLPASRTEFVKTLCDYARFLKYELDNSSAAMEKLKEALEYLEKDSETPANEILDMMNEIADAFDSEENYSEEKDWRERIWNFCKEHFLEDADETLNALNDLCLAYESLEDYGKAERYRRQFRDIKERKFGSFHIETIWAIISLADTLHEAGKYDEELVLREQIVDLY
ncbi:MAG: tetratricopeptide repeat protein, partial [Selenomonadaceae bacterium]|nr:tetratricopeptide repeat protein [Selenomonadaceae bacterium]